MFIKVLQELEYSPTAYIEDLPNVVGTLVSGVKGNYLIKNEFRKAGDHIANIS